MDANYQKILDFMTSSGERLVVRAGKIADIGITKKDVTEEDVLIERGFKEIISTFGSDHLLYGEEENNMFQDSGNVWVTDPISSTATFIAGLPHYAIVIAHLQKRETVFAAVYDPAVKEMFTAYLGKGAFMNGQKIEVDTTRQDMLFFQSKEWKELESANAVKDILKKTVVEYPTYSVAVMCCRVAQGKVGGVILLAKDSFPEFAGGLIIHEAGGKFTNIDGESNIRASDRVFVGGNTDVYFGKFKILQGLLNRRLTHSYLMSIAQAVSAVLSPYFIAIYFWILLCWAYGFYKEQIITGMILALFLNVLPAVVAYIMKKRGIIQDMHITTRKERYAFYMFLCVSCLCAGIVLFLLKYSLGFHIWISFFLTAIVVSLINLSWKISAHAAATGLLCSWIVYAYGFTAAPIFMLLVIACWARVYQKRHTLGQVIAGSIVSLGASLVAIAVISIQQI